MAYKENDTDPPTIDKMSNYGKEAWCNMEGRYSHFVFDLRSYIGNYEISICSLAVFGTVYGRSSAVP